MSSLSSLVVDLQMNSAGLRKGLDEANRQLGAFGKSLDKIGSVVSLATFASITKQVATGLANFVLAGAQAADQTGKLAQSAGISTEAFSQLQYAAKLSGVSGEELAGAMGKLNKNLAEAGAGASQQTALFQALGIKVTDAAGQVRGADAVLGDLAERFAGMKDGASKGALAMEVFGKSGAQLLPFLNQGREGLAQLSAECDRLGLTITDGAAKGAEHFNDNLEKLHMASQGVAAQVASNLAPSLANLTDQLLNSKDSARAMKDAVEGLSAVMRGLVTIGVVVGGVFSAVGATLGRSASAIVSFLKGDFKASMTDAFAVAFNVDAVEAFDKAEERIKGIWDPKSVLDFNANLQPVKNSADDMAKKFKDGTKALEEQAKAAKELGDFLRETLGAKLELDRANAKDQVELSLKTGQISAGADAERQSFNDIGKPLQEVFARITAGFRDFDDALDKATRNQIYQAEALTKAKELERVGALDAARDALAQAEAFGKAADEAGKAAGLFKDLKEKLTKNVSEIDGAMKALGTAVLEAIPRLNALVSAAAQGAQAGGVWGALLAVIVQLMSETTAFQRIINLVNSDLDQVIAAIDPIVSALAGLMEGFDAVSNVLTGAFAEIFKPIGDIIGAIAPLFKTLTEAIAPLTGMLGLIGDMLKPIAGILDLVATLLNLLATPLKIFGMIFEALGFVLKLVMIPLDLIGRLFSGLADLLDPVFKEIDKAFSWLANRLDEFGHFVGTLGERIANWIGGRGFRANSEFIDNDPRKGLKPSQNSTPGERGESVPGAGLISEVTKDTAGAVTGLGESAVEATKAIEKLTEKFTNVPQGFKTALARFQSMDAAGFGMTVGSLAGSALGNLTIIVQGSLVHENQIVQLVEKHQSKSRFRRHGTPIPP